jgi:hypothetical protein
MLEAAIALLMLQELQKAASPPASSEVVGKAQGPAEVAAYRPCIAMPDSAWRGPGALAWYVNAEPVEIGGKRFAKYGLPRVLAPGEVELVATARGAPFYGVTGVPEREVLYLLVDPAGCEFQPYAIEN